MLPSATPRLALSSPGWCGRTRRHLRARRYRHAALYPEYEVVVLHTFCLFNWKSSICRASPPG